MRTGANRSLVGVPMAVSTVWIPAFAGMTGVEVGEWRWGRNRGTATGQKSGNGDSWKIANSRAIIVLF